MKVRLTNDPERVAEIKKALKANDNYCPCKLTKTEDTKCPCKEFLNQTEPGECNCGLYEKLL